MTDNHVSTPCDNDCCFTVEVKTNNKEDDTNDCVICLEALDDKTINYNCGHILHIKCLLNYVKSQLENNQDITCPICRNVECFRGSKRYLDIRHMFGFEDTNEGLNTYPTIGIEEARSRMREEYRIIITEHQQRFNNNMQGHKLNCYAYFKLLCGLISVVAFFVIFFVVMKIIR